MKKLFMLMMAAFTAFACQENPDPEVDCPMQTIEIEAEIAVDQTRTQLGSDGLTIYWQPNEAVGIVGKSGRLYKFTTTNTEPTKKAILKGDIELSDSPAYAFYPYSEQVDNTTLTMELPTVQVQSGSVPQIAGHDLKVGKPKKNQLKQWTCTFKQLLTIIRFDILPNGSAFEGATLTSINLAAKDPETVNGISANLTVDLAAQTVAVNEESAKNNITLTFDENNPTVLHRMKTTKCWITINPTIEAQNPLVVTLNAVNAEGEKVKGVYEFAPKKSLQRGMAYYISMPISQIIDDKEEEDNPNAENHLLSFKLLAANNDGKILPREIRHNPSGKYSYNGSNPMNSGNSSLPYATEGFTLDIDKEAQTVTGCVPYLFNFKLAPTFTLSEGAKAYVDGVEQVSGQTIVDFSQPVEYTVVSQDGYERTYTVTITNTGLPVVVLDATPAGNVNWQEAGLQVYAKSYEWNGDEGHVSVYNADGSIDVDNALAGYRVRGNTTQSMPKKPFAIKFDSKQSVLGMPKHKRWCLLANWVDRTMIRSTVAFEIAHATDEATGMGWNPHGVNVELIYGDIHLGNYYLCEQIKIDGNRIDIQDPYEDVRDDYNDGKRTDAPSYENCGYIMEFTRSDGLDENYYFTTTSRKIGVQFKDDFDKTTEGQAILSQVKANINNIETLLSEKKDYASVKEMINVESFVDWWIVHELTMNNEFKHPKSVYMHQDGAGKVVAGPCWDFDYQTFPNPANIKSLYNTEIDPSLTMFLYQTPNQKQTNDAIYLNQEKYLYGSHVWYATNTYSSWGSSKTRYGLFEHAEFKALVKQRWNAIYGKLAAIINRIDVIAAENAVSESYNSTMWPQSVALNSIKKDWSGYHGDEKMTYEESIANLKNVYQQRLEWMNTQINAF